MNIAVLFPVVGSIIIAGILAKSVSLSVIQKIKIEKIDSKVIQGEQGVFEAICRYITLEQSNPISMNDLISKGYYQAGSNNNGFGGTFDFTLNANAGTVTITTDIADVDARAAYINSYKNTFKPTQGSGNTVNTTFVLPVNVMHGNGQFMSGIPVQSTAPSASKYKYWYDTSGVDVYLRVSDGTKWTLIQNQTTAANTIASSSIVNGTTVLASTAGNKGDIKYLYDSATNSIQQYTYYNGGWVLGGTSNVIQTAGCPYGFVEIPGSENIDGAAKGWCVQKYLPVPFDNNGWSVSTYNTYTYQDAYDTNTNIKLISKGGVIPVSYVSHNNARVICSDKMVDENGNSIPDAMPMNYNVLVKLLKDISSTSQNWSGGAVGSGYIYSGHNDNSPATALIASTSDLDGYYGTGNSSSSGANQKRTLYTSKGDVIWDFAGNLWEQMYEGQNIGGTSEWAEYTATADTNPFDPKLILEYDWNSTQGVGRTIYDNNVATINSITAINPSYWLLRGGDWGNAANTGLFASYWGAYSLANRNGAVSVRCIAKKQ